MIYNIDIDGTTISHTVATGESLTDVLSGLATKINADATTSALVDADASSGDLELTGLSDAITFATTSTVTNVADVDSSAAVTVSGTSSDQKNSSWYYI